MTHWSSTRSKASKACRPRAAIRVSTRSRWRAASSTWQTSRVQSSRSPRRPRPLRLRRPPYAPASRSSSNRAATATPPACTAHQRSRSRGVDQARLDRHRCGRRRSHQGPRQHAVARRYVGSDRRRTQVGGAVHVQPLHRSARGTGTGGGGGCRRTGCDQARRREGLRDGCNACHAAGVAGAPKFGDKAAWAARSKLGLDALVASVTKGKGAMPPKGAVAGATDAELRAAVEYMLAAAK